MPLNKLSEVNSSELWHIRNEHSPTEQLSWELTSWPAVRGSYKHFSRISYGEQENILINHVIVGDFHYCSLCSSGSPLFARFALYSSRIIDRPSASLIRSIGPPSSYA